MPPRDEPRQSKGAVRRRSWKLKSIPKHRHRGPVAGVAPTRGRAAKSAGDRHHAQLAGPFCSMMLGDMGAEVIKIESPDGGDELRSLFRYRGRRDVDQDYFYMFNRNKRSLAVNLKTDAGREILRRLIDRSDVLLENLRPGVAQSLGFSWHDVSARNPRLVYAALSGFGKSLQRRGRARTAYDGVVQAATGVMALNACADGGPRRVSMPLGDILSGMYAAYAIACAVARAQRTGGGEYIDIAMFDSLLSVQGPAVMNRC